MYVLNFIADYDSFINSTNNENEDINNVFKYSLLTIPGSIILICLTGFFYMAND